MSEKSLCVVCGIKSARFWLVNPCEHELCDTCLAKKTDPAVCPGCRGNVQFLSCPATKYGCAFQADPAPWKDHVAKCLYTPVECPYRCEALVTKESLLSHMTTFCPLRPATCQFCASAMYQVEVASHEESCPAAPVTCPNCLLEGIKMIELPSHAESCPKTPKPCPLTQFGCDFTGVDVDLDQHLDFQRHTACFRKLNQRLQGYQDEITHLRAGVDSRKSELDTCKLELDTCKSELDTCKLELDTCKSWLGTCQSELDTCQVELDMCQTELGTCQSERDTCKSKLAVCQ